MRVHAWLVLIALGGCAPSAPPAPSAAPPAKAEANELRDAIQAPIDKARAVEQSVQEDAERQRQAIEDAGG